MEKDTPVVGNAPIEGPSNSQGTQVATWKMTA